MRRALRWLAIGAVALVVAVVGGTYVYIHYIEGDPPAPLTLTTGTTSGSSGSDGTSASTSTANTVSVAGTWKPNSTSIVGYRVHETLFGQSTDAVGRTSAVTGTLVIDGTTVKTASFTVDLTKVSSDRSQRDGQFQGRIMNTARYPTATFTLTSPISLGTLPPNGAIVTYKATGNLELHGTTKPVTLTLKAKRDGGTIAVNGSIPITFADWGIANPSFGPASTDDHGQLEFLLAFAK